MKRKLVKQGAATMMISLPAKWIRENKLEKGDELNVDSSADNLVISLDPLTKKTETEIILSGLTESSIRTLITNTYRSGYDKVKVNFKDKNQFKILQQVIKTRLIGFDIIKKQANSCIVENITEPSVDQFDNLLNKMFLNIEELFKITKIRMGLEKGGETELEDFEEIEERIQNYDNFCRRTIIKEKYIKEKSEFLWTFLSLVLHGQREIYHLNKILGKTKASERVKELLQGSEEIFNLLKQAYSEKKIENISRIHDLEKNLIYKKGYSALEKTKSKENIIIYHLLASIRQFYQANSPLLGLLL